MKTQRLNLLEAMNFAMAGHTVTSYTDQFTLKLKDDTYLAVYHKTFTRGKLLSPFLIKQIQDMEWHAGDDRSITGYYDG